MQISACDFLEAARFTPCLLGNGTGTAMLCQASLLLLLRVQVSPVASVEEKTDLGGGKGPASVAGTGGDTAWLS